MPAANLILVVLRAPREGALDPGLDDVVHRLGAIRMAHGVFLVPENPEALGRLRLLTDEIARGGGATLLGRGAVVDEGRAS